MKDISEEDFERFSEEFNALPSAEQEAFDKSLNLYSKLSEEELVVKIKSFDVPVAKQKEIAAEIEHYVKYLLEKEASSGGFSEGTRKWIVTYTDLLDRIHKNVFGEKRVNFDLKLSHAHLSSLINKYKQCDVIDVASDGVINNVGKVVGGEENGG